MTRIPALVLALAVAASLSACSRKPAAPASDAPTADVHDAHGTAGAAAPSPPAGTLWPTDEPLRTGMSRIQAAVEQASADGRPLSRDAARQLAGTVEENVTYIVRNCKLPPEPDAALHVLIGRMMTAAGVLKGEVDSSQAAVAQLDGVLHDYRLAFDTSP